ncbi:MICAL-like protein 2 [Halotydeus destructor]|nr:MICAL-like protein 2 [Halotydeus destructor]
MNTDSIRDVGDEICNEVVVVCDNQSKEEPVEQDTTKPIPAPRSVEDKTKSDMVSGRVNDSEVKVEHIRQKEPPEPSDEQEEELPLGDEIKNSSDENNVLEESKASKVEDAKDDEICLGTPDEITENYPTDYNPFGDDDETEEEEKSKASLYPTDLNPFGDDDESPETKLNSSAKSTERYDDSLNPFGDEEEDEPGPEPVRLNPTPVPAPRRAKQAGASPSVSPMPSERKTISVGNTSLNRTLSTSPTMLPRRSGSAVPYANDEHVSGPRTSTPQAARRATKKKVAPKPPQVVSPLASARTLQTTDASYSSLPSADSANVSLVSSSMPESPTSVRSSSLRRPSLTPSTISVRSDVGSDNSSLRDNTSLNAMSLRKKRPAPAPPQATRRKVYGSVETIQVDLNEIGDKLAEIQVHVKHLEEAFQSSKDANQAELIFNYLEMARQTCSLARKQEELMYRKREYKLEEEHADIEFQIREIDLKPPFKRTQEDDAKGQELLRRLLEVIDERNDVVENMIKINKRPDFDKSVEKLVQLKSNDEVLPVLGDFLKKYDMNVVETKIIRDNDGKPSRQV